MLVTLNFLSVVPQLTAMALGYQEIQETKYMGHFSTVHLPKLITEKK